MATASNNSNPNHALEFYYDISCPFAYIASTRIEALAIRTNAHLIWCPVLLGAIYRATDAPQGAAGSASDVFNPTKKAITSRAFQRTIQRHGIAYREPPQHPVKTTAALRLLYFADESERPALTKALFRAYWVEKLNVNDPTVLADVVRRSKIPTGDEIVRAIESGNFEGPHERKRLESSTALAVERGSPGVPGFWIADEIWMARDGRQQKGRLYWGQDRMHFVEAVLMALNAGAKSRKSGTNLAFNTPRRSLQLLMPRCARNSGIPKDEEVKMEFWYDFSSPWAFLGWTQLDRLQRQFGERLKIEMKPFLLGILFREIGAPNLPMAAISKQRQEYSRLDHSDWVRWWNSINSQEGRLDKQIDFHWADIFPIRTPTVLRAALVEPNLVGPLFRGCWEFNLDMSTESVLKDVINKSGYNGDQVLARANEPAVKQDLRARTGEAKATGICGVPSYRVFRRKVGQGEDGWKQAGGIVWGQDEVAVVEDLIGGWHGEEVSKIGEVNAENTSSRL